MSRKHAPCTMLVDSQIVVTYQKQNAIQLRMPLKTDSFVCYSYLWQGRTFGYPSVIFRFPCLVRSFKSSQSTLGKTAKPCKATLLNRQAPDIWKSIVRTKIYGMTLLLPCGEGGESGSSFLQFDFQETGHTASRDLLVAQEEPATRCCIVDQQATRELGGNKGVDKRSENIIYIVVTRL